MTVSSTYYWIVLTTTILTLAGLFFIAYTRRPNKIIRTVGIVVVLAVLVVNKWIFPTVYTVKTCGYVTREILLLPTIENGIPLTYGKHCYVINHSNSTLHIETIFYGNKNEINSPDKVIEENVPANHSKEVSSVALDYFFEPEDESVTTKSDGVIKYKVSCDL
jgi:hypothetical protein